MLIILLFVNEENKLYMEHNEYVSLIVNTASCYLVKLGYSHTAHGGRERCSIQQRAGLLKLVSLNYNNEMDRGGHS